MYDYDYREYSIYIASDQSANELVQTVGHTLGVKFLPVTGEKDRYNPDFWIYWLHADSSMRLLISDHVFEDSDRDMDFPNYDYRLLVGIHHVQDVNEAIRLAALFSRQVFDKLKASRRYRMMLVGDVQTLIEKCDPATTHEQE